MNCIFYLTLLALISVICWSCPYDVCKEHTDYGSCGNACCKLGFTLASSTFEAMVKLNGTIVRGGPDKQYTAQMTAEGTLGFADLREFGVGVDFIGQAFHVTDSGEYTDTINFTLIPGGFGKRGSRLIVFSISQIGGGALCRPSPPFPSALPSRALTRLLSRISPRHASLCRQRPKLLQYHEPGQ